MDEITDITFITNVLSHYATYGRHDLPWRKSITPYRILVSEIMLQQTQVARVLPKFALWMKQYPTLKSLEKAQLSAVLSLWQGLGYQRRAKALVDLARGVRRLPKRYEELVALPGVGPYTASAIMAFAYDEFPPHLLETNIRTALIEAFHLPAPQTRQAGMHKKTVHDEVLYKDLQRLMMHARVKRVGAREWYSALMDYGAYLKSKNISHNTKSAHHTQQSAYKGSVRELRAKVLFAITHKQKLPEDGRTDVVLSQLVKEGYLKQNGNKYQII